MANSVSKSIELNHNSVALAGEFAVLSQLALRGFDANMTLGNTKSVDILVSNPKTDQMFKLEVKTHYGKKESNSILFGHTLDWVMSEKHERISSPNLFYCFVYIHQDKKSFRFFIVPSNIVARYVREQHQYWLRVRESKAGSTSIRRFRIGIDQSPYNIETPLAIDLEDKWEF